MFLPIILVSVGYSVLSWGRLMIKGYNVTFWEWVDPFHPFVWPATGDPQLIPPGQLLPGDPRGASGSGGSAGGANPYPVPKSGKCGPGFGRVGDECYPIVSPHVAH